MWKLSWLEGTGCSVTTGSARLLSSGTTAWTNARKRLLAGNGHGIGALKILRWTYERAVTSA
jgi:hypothetical protein